MSISWPVRAMARRPLAPTTGLHWVPSVPAWVKRITVSASLSSSAALGGAARAWASPLSWSSRKPATADNAARRGIRLFADRPRSLPMASARKRSKGGHYVLAVSRRASARPERVDHQIEMSAPVEPWPRAHRADHAADQHRDVGRLYAGTDRPRAPGAFDQLGDDRDQLVLLGLRLRPGRLRVTARQRVLDPGVPGGRLRDTAQQPLDQRERFSAGLERLARPPGEQAERLADQLC